MSHSSAAPPLPSAEFDANRFPLAPGIRLLEASAGTGKTFALAHLVLRLVAERDLSLRDLLVVTFTEAAAAELRDRIALRLQQALAVLEQPPRPPPDQVLEEWLEPWLAGRALHPPNGAAPPSIDRLRGRLLLALEELDGADITTIHGFCLRSLRRQALEAGSSPDLQLETDASILVGRIVHDYWQGQVLALPPSLLAGLGRRGVSPRALEDLLLRLDGDPALRLDPLPEGLSPQSSLAGQLPQLWAGLWRSFERQWRQRGSALDADLRAAAGHWHGLGAGSTQPYARSPRRDRCREIDALLAAQQETGDGGIPGYEDVLELEPLTSYFHPGTYSRMARKVEGSGAAIRLPQRSLMEAVAELVDGPAGLTLRHACHWGRAELRRRRLAGGTQGFSQLLENLDPGPEAEGRSALLQAVAARYRVALIDEFQDTDPIQWRILQQAFGSGSHQLVMVGDPKQAIYRFRGGDLATYLSAAAQAEERCGLTRNRRSTAPLIEALNGLMVESGLRRSQLPVPPVAPMAGRSGPDMPPVELLWLGGDRPAGERLPSASALEERLPAWIASYCCDLLQRGLSLEVKGSRRRLLPDDLCLLVSTNHQAGTLRIALQRRGIPSRLVSRADVFASPAATALQRFLDALADPADPSRLRLLAASPLLGWSAAEIAAAAPDRWSELAGELERQAHLLPRQGLLGTLAERLGSESLARISLDGRLLADLQQVSELVQAKLHADQLGPAAAADWLRRLRLDERRAERTVPEEHQVHSDRVDGTVSVVTVHASKGLEYPVVICPYLWQVPSVARRGGSRRFGVRWHPPGEAQPRLSLEPDSSWGRGREAVLQHRAAEQAERERLAYVAATRAQHLLLLAWGPAAGQQCNPLFPWLFPDEPLPEADDDRMAERSDAEWRARLEEGIGRRGLPLRLVEPSGTTTRWRPAPPATAEPLRTGPVPRRRLDTSWGRSSYTSWTGSGHGDAAAASDEGRDITDPSAGLEDEPISQAEAEGDAPPQSRQAWPEQGPLADFPRGAAAGDCLHRILEQLDYRCDAGEGANRTVVQRELRRAGLEQQPIDPVLAGIDRLRRTPFGGALRDFRLERLEPQRRLNEMHFDLSLGFARAERLAAAFADHPGGAFGPAYAERLAALPVASRGFLTGSIDLVFTAPDPRGSQRWWVADWKSNWLGRRDGEGRAVACGPRHYGSEAMARLMAQHHYPLQAHLYLVALHRYLRWRLPAYDPGSHLGGYAYVFLRGTPGEEGEGALPGEVPGMFVEQPPLARLLALDAALGSPDPHPGDAAGMFPQELP